MRHFADPQEVAAAMARMDSRSKSAQPGVQVASMRYALSGGSPGGWSSDHLAESEHFTGWNYVAVRAIALQCAQASVNCYESWPVVEKRLGKSQAKSLRETFHARHGSRVKAYNLDADKGEPLDIDHRLRKLLKRPRQSGASFRYEQSIQMSLTGKCLIWNVPNRAGLTVERYVVPTAIAQPQAPTRDYPYGYWRITPQASRYSGGDGYFLMAGMAMVINGIIPAEQMQVVMWPHPIVRDDGQSPLASGALWTDTADMVDKSRWASMKNGPNSSLVVNAPDSWDGTLEELEAAAKKFNDKYAGPENHGKAIFTTAGSVTSTGMDAEEMDYGNAFIQLRDAILAIHGTPGVADGVTDGGSYAAFYAALLQFTTLTVQPQLSLCAEEDTEQLARQFGEGITIEMLARPIDDPNVLENTLRTDLQGKIRTRNEFRSIRGLEPLKGKEGDELVGGNAVGQDPYGDRTESTTGIPGVPRIGISAPAKPAIEPAANIPGDAAPENLASTQSLNGAQITAAKDLLNDVSTGNTAPLVAIELLTALGIDPERAKKMVQAAEQQAQKMNDDQNSAGP